SQEQARDDFTGSTGAFRNEIRRRCKLGRTVPLCDASVETIAVHPRSYRRLAASAELSEQRALRPDRSGADRIMQRLQSLSRRLVIIPNFYAEGALPRCRHHVERVDRRALAAETQSLEPRDREQRHVQTIARFDFTNTRRDVATQWHDLEIGAQKTNLGDAAQARRPDPRARRQIGERGAVEQRLTAIVAPRKRGEDHSVRASRRQVLQRESGDV